VREPFEGGASLGLPLVALPDCSGGAGEPALGPISHSGEHRLKGATSRGEPVAHPNRWTRIDEAFDKAFGFKLAQSLGEHAVTNAGNPGKKLIESSRRRDQGFHHRPGPTLPYQLNGALKGRAVVKAPTDHGERFYAVSVVSETTRLRYFFYFFDLALNGLVRKPSTTS
jgi:hypothetical protein